MSITELQGTTPHLAGTTGQAADRIAIEEVIAAYGHFLDACQWEAFEDLFVEDATYDISPDPKLIPVPLAGRAAIVKEMRGVTAKRPAGVFPRHMATNILFRHLEETRAGTSSFLAVVFTYADGRIELRRAGTYVDEFCKVGDRWRFAGRHLRLDTAEPPPVSGN